MTGYRLVATLYDVQPTRDAGGNVSISRAGETRVFANRYSVGLSTWAAGAAHGLHPDAVLSVRSCDYAGQGRCDVDGKEFTVESASDSGEFTRLTLKRRLSNG